MQFQSRKTIKIINLIVNTFGGMIEHPLVVIPADINTIELELYNCSAKPIEKI